MSTSVERAPQRTASVGEVVTSIGAAPSGEAAKIESIERPPEELNTAIAPAPNPLSSASLVPMLIAGLVFTAIAMIVAIALS